MLVNAVWLAPGVTDVTAELQRAEGDWPKASN